MSADPRILIIGAGPTGLGAGYRLAELGYQDWDILEASDYVGGLATSFTDDAGFTYDIGGHVMFSHYRYYDELVDRLMGSDYTELNREAWVWMENRFIAYPFQNNIRGLEPQTVFDCVTGLIEAQRHDHRPTNFAEWIDAVFGAGIGRHFMVPYNFKVWATPAELMNYVWIGERVSVVDTEAILRNVILGEDQASWGPNNTFRYPLRGGTGFLYDGMRRFVEPNLHLCRGLCRRAQAEGAGHRRCARAERISNSGSCHHRPHGLPRQKPKSTLFRPSGRLCPSPVAPP